MKSSWMVGAVGFLSIIAGPAQAASCKDDIDKVGMHTRDMAKSSIAHSGGGEGVAAEREAPSGDHSRGDDAMQAKVALNEARVALSKGDEAGCEAALARAHERLVH